LILVISVILIILFGIILYVKQTGDNTILNSGSGDSLDIDTSALPYEGTLAGLIIGIILFIPSFYYFGKNWYKYFKKCRSLFWIDFFVGSI
jgi:uncharacterized membrane protein